MNVLAVHTPTTRRDLEILDQMHRLRAKVFQGRLSWNVQCINDHEHDEFDRLAPTYIIVLSSKKRVVGCARLLPAMDTTMLGSVFPQLLHSGRLSAYRGMIESSRFCVDTDDDEGRGGGSFHTATLTLFAGILEWCLRNGYSEFATATDVRFERILNRAGWPMRRLGSPTMINETRSVAGVLPVDFETFHRLRSDRYNSSFAATQTRAA
jgi:N-acyl-L-homoserine lactone synthetase